MDRKKGIVAAATIAGSLLATSTAYALTSGIIGGGPDDGAGDLSPVVEVPTATGATTAAPGADVDVAVSGGRSADHGFDDDAFEDEGPGHEREEGDEPFEHEGSDDDD
jgi:hypothetical protein